jgi:hypothetical protein
MKDHYFLYKQLETHMMGLWFVGDVDVSCHAEKLNSKYALVK